MFSTEELGTIYYRDALEAHALVIRALMTDPKFKDLSRNFNIEPMINRLMRITHSYEEPWLESIRRRRRSPGKHYCGNMKNVGLTGWMNNGNALRE